MAILDISEYQSLAKDQQTSAVMTGVEPAMVAQQVAIGGTSAQSAAFADTTRFVRVHTDVACRVKFGADPTAANKSEIYDWAQLGLSSVPNGSCLAFMVVSSTTSSGTLRGGGKIIHG